MVAAGCDGSAGSVQPAADAWISYQPESTSQWKTPSAAVVSGFVVGWIPGLETSTGAYGPAEMPDRRIVTVAPLTGLPLVSRIVPLGSTSPVTLVQGALWDI